MLTASKPLPAFAAFACAIAAFLAFALVAPKITGPVAAPAQDGRTLFVANCAACHGANAQGDRTPAEVGFTVKMPNFQDCGYATREADGDWLATMHRGGPERGFIRNMPAWDKTLTEDEFAAILGYLRSFCLNSGYPRGDLNLPLAMFTEKAFPEDELVNETTINTKGLENIVSTTTLEKRFGKTSQLELEVPFSAADPGLGRNYGGLGDVTVGWKQNLYANLDQGAIFSLMPEVQLPTGDMKQGLGQGYTSFQAHALFAKTLGPNYFLQGDLYGVFPTVRRDPDQANLNLALGRTFAEDGGFGRAWTPQVELLTSHNLSQGAPVDFDIVPQMQVSLSRLQHVLISAGYRIPLNDTKNPDHKPQFAFYLIWDWYDGGLFQGW